MKPIRFIADIGSNHNNSLCRIRRLIEEAKEVGCWAVKFQLFEANKLFAKDYIPKGLKDKELNSEWIINIRNMCDDIGIKFGCTPFDLDAVCVISPYVDFIKISSFDILRTDLIEACSNTGLPIHLSTGMADRIEINNAIFAAKKIEVLYHCVSKYPAQIKEIYMHKLRSFNTLIGCSHVNNFGWSDHSRNNSVICAAVSYGANYIEVHFDREDFQGQESIENGGAESHCWSPYILRKAIRQANTVKDVLYNIPTYDNEGLRKNRADPIDGKRPMISSRNTDKFY